MNIPDKTKLEIEALSHMIQYGIEQPDTASSLNILLDKITGKIPLGSDAASFNARKRIVLLHTLFKLVYFLTLFSLSLIMSLMFLFICWNQQFQNLNYIFLCVGLVALGFCYLFTFKIKNSYQLYFALKNISQTQPDPESKLSVVDHFDLAQRFSKQRQLAQIIGCLIALVSGGLLYQLYQIQPSPISTIATILPFMFMLGLGIMLSPISKAESQHLYGTTQLPWKHFPAAIKMCVVIGVILSILMFGCLQGFISP